MIPAYGVEVGPSGVNYTETAPTLDARCKDGPIRNQLGMMVANTLLAKGNDSHGADISTYIPEVSHCLNAGGMGRQDYETETLITSPIAFKTEMSDPEYGMDVCPTLQTQNSHSVATQYGDVAGALTARHDSSPCADRGQNMIPHGMAVRRLTPRECERLQGFPDDYSLIPYRGKPAADGPRYKAIGNSWAVPKFRWVGERIQMVERFLRP